jgi:hypothetical protein
MRLVHGLVLLDERLQVVGGEIRVELDALRLLHGVDFVLERLVLAAHRGAAEHVDEAAVAVVGEPRVAGLLRQPFDARVREAEVQDGVHHARHGQRRTAPHGHQQRVGVVPELLAERLLDFGEALVDLRDGVGGDLLPLVVVRGTHFRGDGEAGRDGDADLRHLGEVGPLAAEEFLHLAVAVGGAVPEEVDVLRTHECP